MLAEAVGPNLTKLLHDQLDLMFACGLSEPLVQALTFIARDIGPLLKTIQGDSDIVQFCWTGPTDQCRSTSRIALRDSERSVIQTSRCAAIPRGTSGYDDQPRFERFAGLRALCDWCYTC